MFSRGANSRCCSPIILVSSGAYVNNFIGQTGILRNSLKPLFISRL
jgi:hypothetical protein